MKPIKESELDSLILAYEEAKGTKARPRKCLECNKEFYLVDPIEGLRNSDPEDDWNTCRGHIIMDVLEMYELHLN